METIGHRLAVASQKGGVGKTTVAANLAVAFSDLEFKTLVVEVDPQGSLIRLFGLDRYDLQQGLFGVLGGGIPTEAAVATVRPNLDLLPANVWSHEEELTFLDRLGADPGILRRILDPVAERYEVILLDCPPGLGPMTRAALIAADRYLVPVQAESMNMGTLPRLELLADRVRQEQNPGLTLEGYVATMVDARTRHATDILGELTALYGDRLFKTSIPRSVRVAEESARGRPSVAARGRNRASEAFQALAEEFLFRQAPRASSPPRLRVVESGDEETGDWGRSEPSEFLGARASGFEFLE